VVVEAGGSLERVLKSSSIAGAAAEANFRIALAWSGNQA